ncbi:MAG: hypothetical protein D6678_04745 [Zetaproteobacteria bacterium]|nr:MAG: hypothetical protein D6678_04745 [Zetaproteobacteria bacterium]
MNTYWKSGMILCLSIALLTTAYAASEPTQGGAAISAKQAASSKTDVGKATAHKVQAEAKQPASAAKQAVSGKTDAAKTAAHKVQAEAKQPASAVKQAVSGKTDAAKTVTRKVQAQAKQPASAAKQAVSGKTDAAKTVAHKVQAEAKQPASAAKQAVSGKTDAAKTVARKVQAEVKRPSRVAAANMPEEKRSAYVPVPVPAQPLQAVKVRKPLRGFIHDHARRFIVLRQSEASYPLDVPLSYRVEPSAIRVHLVFTNSNALLKGRSQLRLRWNGGVFAQAPLDPAYPDGAIDVQVPLELTKSGGNELAIEVSQHYLSECEDPGSPELWTMVDMDSSYIELDGTMRPLQPTLRAFDNLLASANWGDLHVMMVPLSKSEEHLHAGTLLAESIANRAGKQTVIIDSVELAQTVGSTGVGHDLIVFGTYKEAERLLGPVDVKGDAKGHIFVRARQNDPGHFLLAVLGRTPGDLVKAASAFAWATLPLADEASMDVFDVKVPEAMAYSSLHAVQEGREYNFSDLGFQTTTMKGLQDKATVSLWLPPDLFSKNHARVEMRLHFSYGAALRPDSVLNIYHNGQFLRGISLSDPRGLLVRDYRIWIPLYAFRPGLNEFRFESRMHANTGTNCTTGNTDNLLLTLFDDSTFTIPDTSHYVAMPDLNYLVNTGYPYLGDLGDTPVIQIPKLNARMLASAWTLAARLGQLKGSPIQRLTIADHAGRASNIIRLDTFANIEDSIWAAAPVNLGRNGFINHPSLANPSVLGHEPLTWRKKLNMLLSGSEYESPETVGPRYHSVGIRQSFSLKNQGALMQFENPKVDGGTMTLLVSDSEHQLAEAVEHLVQLWPQMQDSHGDLLLWGTSVEKGQPDFWSGEVGSNVYHIGNMPYLERITYFAIQYPVFLLVVLVLMFLFMVILTRALLIMYRHQTHPHIEP